MGRRLEARLAHLEGNVTNVFKNEVLNASYLIFNIAGVMPGIFMPRQMLFSPKPGGIMPADNNYTGLYPANLFITPVFIPESFPNPFAPSSAFVPLQHDEGDFSSTE
jgi:hypothetical protein